MQLDTSNIEFQRAFNLVTQTNRNVFLTGRAGTGKTTFLKYLKQHSSKSMAVIAPTGIAAINAGGVTANSFFQIKPGFNAPDSPPSYELSPDKREVLKGLDLLIIDEISMVRSDLLEMIDRTCRYYGNKNQPFGGKQVLFIGDPYQLPPIVSNDEKDIFYKFYKSAFFFKSGAFWSTNPIPIELKKIYRQNEKVFIDLLNKIRINDVTEADISLLNKKVVGTDFPFSDKKFLCLGTKNDQINAVNETELDKIPSKLVQITGKITGKFDKNQLPTLETLLLKNGAQVMFIKNDTGGRRYYNGKLGVIQKIEDETIEVSFPEGGSTYVDRATWEKIRYEWDDKENKVVEKVEGTFTQYPLKLAWAITVHKSQGLSLDRVYADIGGSWDSGQVYVGLSRCTSFDGLKLAKEIPRYAIRVDPEVEGFYKWVLAQTTLQDLPPKIVTLKADKVLLTEPGPIKFEWEVEGAKTISFESQTNLPPQGSMIIRPRKERRFELVASNEFGVTVRKIIEIEVRETPPIIHFFESDRLILTDNTPARLSWKVEGAEKVEIIGNGDVTGKRSINFFTPKDCELILRAEGYFGSSVTKKIQILVSKEPPIIEYFITTQEYVVTNTPIELSWQVKNAERIEIAPIQVKQKAPSGTHVVHIYESTLFQLTAWTPFGVSSRRTLTIHVIPVPIIESLWVPHLTINTHLNIEIERPLPPDFRNTTEGSPSFQLVKIDTDSFTKPMITNNLSVSERRFPDIRALFHDIRQSISIQIQNLIEQLKK